MIPLRYRAVVYACLPWLVFASAAWAHEPLFMASHEAPGKGAFDMHLEITGDRTEAEDETEYEVEATWGLTRDLALQVGLPMIVRSGVESEPGSSLSASGFGDPEVALKWRFWDRPFRGGRNAAAAFLRTTVPVGEKGFGRDRPTLLAGVARGREGLKHYYFVDARYAYAVPDGGDQPGDALFLDAAYGLRPVRRGLEQTDVVFIVEANWEDHDRDRFDGSTDAASGGRFFSLAVEALISPFNRFMIRGGVQVPVSQSIPQGAPRRDLAFRLAAEFRF